MNKAILEQLVHLKGEAEDLRKRLHNVKQSVVSDSVVGSSKEFPYTQHNCIIEGIDINKVNKDKKYRRMIKQKELKITKIIREAEYELDSIEDSSIRQIIRHVYFDGKNYNQTAHIMNKNNPKKEYTADGIRMQLKRFFKKN